LYIYFVFHTNRSTLKLADSAVLLNFNTSSRWGTLSITGESSSTTLKIVSVHSVSKITVVGTSSSVEITGMAIIKADNMERVNFMVV